MATNDDSDSEKLFAELGLPVSFGQSPRPKKRRRIETKQTIQPEPKKYFIYFLPPPIVKKPFPFPLRTVLAPMVGINDLAFRLLCRFIEDVEYQNNIFFSQLDPSDRPLIVQFCGNSSDVITKAAKIAEPHCDCIDINLGCPQTQAQEQLFGAYLLDREHWPKIFSMIKSLKESIRVPISCKIRIFPTIEETIEFVKLLEQAGCDLISVHGRERGSPTYRRKGPANLQFIREIVKKVTVPVITNGNVRCSMDVVNNLNLTKAAGIMVGECLMKDPLLFARLCVDKDRENVVLLEEKEIQENPPEEKEACVDAKKEKVEVIQENGEKLKEAKEACIEEEGAEETKLIQKDIIKQLDKEKEIKSNMELDDGVTQTKCKFCESNHLFPKIGSIALEYISLCEKYPTPGNSFSYIFNHLVAFLRRSGKGNRTTFHFCGNLKTNEIRGRLSNINSMEDVRDLIKLTLPM